MKLLYCGHCGDIVRLFPTLRSCLCGKSFGKYLPDNATTAQIPLTLSLGLANPDFGRAVAVYNEAPEHFSPELSIRAWINPTSEPDVVFVDEETLRNTAPTKRAGAEAE